MKLELILLIISFFVFLSCSRETSWTLIYHSEETKVQVDNFHKNSIDSIYPIDPWEKVIMIINNCEKLYVYIMTIMDLDQIFETLKYNQKNKSLQSNVAIRLLSNNIVRFDLCGKDQYIKKTFITHMSSEMSKYFIIKDDSIGLKQKYVSDSSFKYKYFQNILSGDIVSSNNYAGEIEIIKRK